MRRSRHAVLLFTFIAIAQPAVAQHLRFHFKLLADGGYSQLEAQSPADTAAPAFIRTQIQTQVTKFSAGEFGLAGLSPDLIPPGLRQMEKLRTSITFKYQETPRGGRLLFISTDPAAIQAIHDFLRFEIESNRTGDPTTIEGP